MEEEKKLYGEVRKLKKEQLITKPILFLAVLAIGLLVFNQFQINSVSGMALVVHGLSSGDKDLSNIDLNNLKSTAHSLAALFPVTDIETTEDAMTILFPTGTPDYGEQLGVSYDDPVKSLEILARMYRDLKYEVKQNDPKSWQRFMDIASKPVGISCEFCCGLGPVGIDKSGNSACGCQHNPALLTVTLYLTAYTDYNDAEILREAMRWKTLFFPKDMIKLGMTVSGGDTAALNDLPGMVGGC